MWSADMDESNASDRTDENTTLDLPSWLAMLPTFQLLGMGIWMHIHSITTTTDVPQVWES
jgi:hypothetical protein